jgi:hypothetical protein
MLQLRMRSCPVSVFSPQVMALWHLTEGSHTGSHTTIELWARNAASQP